MNNTPIDASAMHKLSYGLFVLTTALDGKDNGCIINTAIQVTDNPKRLLFAVNRQNYTNEMLKESGVFALSVLTEETPFEVFEHFGFQSGRDADKFIGTPFRCSNGVAYCAGVTNAVFAGKIESWQDVGTHTVFIAEVEEAKVLSDVPSVTYSYYFANIKPKPQPKTEQKKGYVCKICGYVYEGDELPADFTCPLCKHPASDFEPL